MAFLLTLCLSSVWDLGVGDHTWVSTSDNVFSLLDISHRCTYTMTAVEPVQPPLHLAQYMNLTSDLPRDLPRLKSFLALHKFLLSCERSCLVSACNDTKQRLLILLLLLLSGNVQPNPGPELQCIQTPSDSESLSSLKIVHLNVHSLLTKMDMVRIQAKSTDADIVVISETWQSKSIADEYINMVGYNIFRTNRPKKGGGVAIYIKSKFNAGLVLSESICKKK